MQNTYDQYLAWMAKLTEWRGTLSPDHPHLAVAAESIRSVLAGISDSEAGELTDAFAAAFGMEVTQATRLLMPDDIVVPEAKASRILPVPLRRGSLFDDYVNWLSEQESPPQYHVYSLATVLSAAYARRSMMRIGGLAVYPNMFTILLGPTGSRKDGAFDYATAVVGRAVDNLHVLPTEGSPQAFADILAKRAQDTGVSDGLIPVPELRSMFGREKYKEAMVTWLTDWYKCPGHWSRAAASRGGLVELKKVYVTLLGGTTMDWLKTMPEDALTGGFLLARVLMIPAVDKKHWKIQFDLDDRERDRIISHINYAMVDVPGMYTWSSVAHERIRSWYEEELPQRFEIEGERGKAFLQRVHVHVMKLAMLVSQVDYGSGEIGIEALDYAIDLAQWTEQSIRPFLSVLDDREPVYADVIRALRQKHGKATEREMVRALRNRYKAAAVRSALEDLAYQHVLNKARIAGETAFVLSGLE